jgi:hypothetical protein
MLCALAMDEAATRTTPEWQAALQGLSRKELMECGGGQWRYTVELFRRWVFNNHMLNFVSGFGQERIAHDGGADWEPCHYPHFLRAAGQHWRRQSEKTRLGRLIWNRRFSSSPKSTRLLSSQRVKGSKKVNKNEPLPL